MAPNKNKGGFNYLTKEFRGGHTTNQQLPEKIRCCRCNKLKSLMNYSNKQLEDARYQHQRSKPLQNIKCRACSGGPATELYCNGCDEVKGLDEFSKVQRRTPDEAKCQDCIEKQLNYDPEEVDRLPGGPRECDDDSDEVASNGHGDQEMKLLGSAAENEEGVYDEDNDAASSTIKTTKSMPSRATVEDDLATHFEEVSIGTSSYPRSAVTSRSGGIKLPGYIPSPVAAVDSSPADHGAADNPGPDWQQVSNTRTRSANPSASSAVVAASASSTSTQRVFSPNQYGNPSSRSKPQGYGVMASSPSTPQRTTAGRRNFAKVRAAKPARQLVESDSDKDIKGKGKAKAGRPPIDLSNSESSDDDNDE